MKYVLPCILIVLTSASCSKRADVAPQDSVFTTPMVAHVDTTAIRDTTGLVLDPLAISRSETEKQLAHIPPAQVLKIYEDYRPIRAKKALTDAELNDFLTQHKIDRKELRAVLEEGDRLGWANPQ